MEELIGRRGRFTLTETTGNFYNETNSQRSIKFTNILVNFTNINNRNSIYYVFNAYLCYWDVYLRSNMIEIKFRFYNKNINNYKIRISENTLDEIENEDSWQGNIPWKRIATCQYTGLKDKNGNTSVEVYECDIIDVDGKVKGNIYEMDAGETDLVIQGFGTKTWCKTYNEAISRGCHDSE